MCSLTRDLACEQADMLVTTEVEFDGFVTVDWSLTLKPGQALDGLAVEIPLRPEHAKYLYTWPTVRPGALKADFASRFKPIVWLGDEDRGLSWVCESDESWLLSDPERAVQVLKRDREVVLRPLPSRPRVVLLSEYTTEVSALSSRRRQSLFARAFAFPRTRER